MADAFYTLQEAAAKLNKTEEEVQEMVKGGKLREYRGDTGDKAGPLFKSAEVDALTAEASPAAPEEALGEIEELISDDEISLAPEPGEGPAEEGKSGGGDTTALTGEGINVLGDEKDEDYKLADDTMSETKVVSDGGTLDDTLSATRGSSAGEASLEEIEGDVNLDTFGSGSGLLDLSLQADDTSLGGILDEIYTPGSEGEVTPAPEASAMDVAAEAEQLMPDEVPAVAEPGPEAPVMVQGYAEPAPDALSNAFGIVLLLPLLAIIYTTIVTTADFHNVIPAVRTGIQNLIWYIAGGIAAASGVIIGAAFMLSNKGSKTTVKKKEKKKKEKKKKGKKGKEASEAEAVPEPEPETEIT